MFKSDKINSLISLIFIIISINIIINKNNYFFLILIIISLMYIFIINKNNLKKYFIYLLIILIFINLFLFIPSKYNYSYLINLINKKSDFFYLRNKALDYIKTIYDDELYKFVSMIIFNEKHYDFNFYNDLKKLGLLHLLTVSGFHINIFLIITNKFILKNKKISNIFNIIFVLLYGYFLNFSISCLRIFTYYITKIWFDKYTSLVLSCLINLFLFCHLSINFGFILSYGCTLLIFRIIDLDINNINKSILINLLCSLFSNLVLLSINKYINITSFLFSFIMGPIIIISYLIIFCTWFINYKYIVEIIFLLINKINKLFLIFNINLEIQNDLIFIYNFGFIPFQSFMINISLIKKQKKW